MKKFSLLILLSILPYLQCGCETLANNSSVTETPCPYLYYCDNDQCLHKSIFPPTFLEIIGSLILIIITALTATARIAGGGIFVVFLMVIFNYGPVKAISIAFCLVLGSNLPTLKKLSKMRD